jgi:hypothetical protein
VAEGACLLVEGCLTFVCLLSLHNIGKVHRRRTFLGMSSFNKYFGQVPNGQLSFGMFLFGLVANTKMK